MKKLLYISIIGILLGVLSAIGTISVERASVRSGPGAFFPVVAELTQGTEFSIVQDDEGWVKITSNAIDGYLSKRAMESRRSSGQPPNRVQSRQVDFTVSTTGVSAAVRGFSTQFASVFRVRQSLVDSLAQFRIDPESYRRFRVETYRGVREATFRRQHRLPSIRHEMLYYPIDEEGAGLAMAAGVAMKGLNNNRHLTNYINFVGQQIVEVSHSYDLGFRFFILDTEQSEAYSTPGGYIFISEGLLYSLRNEAELAAVLAHEIAHVILRHGLTEMDIRNPLLSSDSAFRELSEQMNRTDDEKRIIESLNQSLLDYQHRLYSARTEVYEHEADELAIVYLARSGYSPHALQTMVQRLLQQANPDFEQPFIIGELEMRLEYLNTAFSSRRWRGNYFFHQDRFLQAISL